MKKLDKKYNFKEVEKKWQKYWQDNNIYNFDWKDADVNNVFSIDTPPPTVSGTLHMGHIFSYSQGDFIARYQRMSGKNVFYPIGFDDNGLPTERYIEKLKGIKGKELPRNEFIDICKDNVHIAEDQFEDLFKSVSFSFDWSAKYQTISNKSKTISQLSFLDLYNKGVLYQKSEPCIWDVADQTALAQTELEDKEIESQMNYLTFDVVDKLDNQNDILFTSKRLYFKFINLDSIEDLKTIVDMHNNGEIMKFVGFPNGLNTTIEKEKQRRLLDREINRMIICYDKETNERIGYCSLYSIEDDKEDITKTGNIDKKQIALIDYKIKKEYWGNGLGTEIVSNLINYIYNTLKLDVEISTDPNLLNTASIRVCEKCGFKKTGIIIKNKDTNNVECSFEILRLSKKNFTKIDIENNKLKIMTTRPELLPACVAVICHPDNFEKFKNKEVITPLGVKVPIFADDKVDKEKGTGFVMCCTFGDQTDIEWWKKFNLDLRIILNEVGRIDLKVVKDLINEKYLVLDGLKVKEAREKILELLKEDGFIFKEPEKIIHPVKIGERSKTPIEFLITKQWFIKVLDIKEELHKKASEINWCPKWMESRIHNWIDGLSWDWCISRQRFSGIPIPVWYSKRAGEEGKVLLPKTVPVDPMVDLPDGYTRDEVIAETDVLDTWATSSLSPNLSSQGINKENIVDEEKFNKLKLPFSLRTQAHEIIRTWAFCTIVKAYYHQDIIPWENIMISGWCLASDKTKMSKSLGNVVSPIGLIEEKGSDAVRYWAGNSSLGMDTTYSDEMIGVGQKLVLKLFNAGKFAEMHFANCSNYDFKNITNTIDLCLLNRIKNVVEQYNKHFNNFDYNKALEVVENFFWTDFCDNYLEISKVRCYGANGTKYQGIELKQDEVEKINQDQLSAINTIYFVFNYVLKLFAPFIPCVCEEIYSCLYEEEFLKTKSINARNNGVKINFEVEDNKKIWDIVLRIVADVRKFKSEKNISIKEVLEKIEVSCDIELDNCVIEDLKNVCNVKNIIVIKGDYSINYK